MFDKLQNSWSLVKASGEVLSKDKKLLLFPVFSGIASLLVSISFFMPLFASEGLRQTVLSADQSSRMLTGLYAFSYYLALYFVTFYCNSALTAAAMIRLRGGEPTVSDGLSAANKRAGTIFGYALIGATVGMVLRTISERFGFIGRLVVAFLGTAWNLATYLVVPVLVCEDVSPVDAVKRSTELLKKTWGESLLANAGMNIIFGWMTLGVMMVGFAGVIFALVNKVPMLMFLFIGLMITWLLALSVVGSALRGVYAAALYRFATDGTVGAGFDENLIKQAFLPKA